jgi:23S rRNA G2069 N7-methylase RlmK/C1962 C5-methylase RlmI
MRIWMINYYRNLTNLRLNEENLRLNLLDEERVKMVEKPIFLMKSLNEEDEVKNWHVIVS